MTTPPTSRERAGSPVLLVLASIVSIQFGAALAATLVHRVGAGGSVLLRLGISSVLLLAIARPGLRGHSGREWLLVVGFGISLAGMNFSLYSALGHLPIGVAVTIEFVGPLALSAARSRRGLDRVAVLAAGLGVALVSGALGHAAGMDLVGVIFAASAGAMWALYIVLAQRVGAVFPRIDGLALAMVVATLVVVPLGAGVVPSLDGDLLLRGLGIAVLSTVVPYSLEIVVLRRLDPRVFGVLLSLEPAVAALAGLLVLHQSLGPSQLLGMSLVVLASVLVVAASRPGRPLDPAETTGA